MYEYYAHGTESMVCQHVVDWSRQALRYLDDLGEQGMAEGALAEWRTCFASLGAEATAMLTLRQGGCGSVGRLLERAHDSLKRFRQAC